MQHTIDHEDHRIPNIDPELIIADDSDYKLLSNGEF